mmetsp:Transcript_18154/g.41624  ORF Transcript_18154/g.41624 Transcript_18154/m.41624 type:complete len:97 (-) Transcript_18154:613-903(-)
MNLNRARSIRWLIVTTTIDIIHTVLKTALLESAAAITEELIVVIVAIAIVIVVIVIIVFHIIVVITVAVEFLTLQLAIISETRSRQLALACLREPP